MLRACDGVAGLELIRSVLPAAVVLDIKLPRLDGWQVLAELKATRPPLRIPVVIASVVDDRPRGLALGRGRVSAQAGQGGRSCSTRCGARRRSRGAV